MASTNETGHAKNVAKFDQVIGYCTGYGAAYNPSKASIKLTALNTMLTSAQAALAAVKASKTAFDNATNTREAAFVPLKKLSTKVLNALAATDASRLTIDDANSANLKIQGRRAKAKAVVINAAKEGEPVAENGNISASQQGFDNLVDHFARLTQTVSAEAMYKPNEVELQVASLNTLLTDLKNKNKAVVAAITNLSNARIARDKIMYTEGTGMCDTALAVKQYVKSLFGPSSPQYKQLSGISFTKAR